MSNFYEYKISKYSTPNKIGLWSLSDMSYIQTAKK